MTYHENTYTRITELLLQKICIKVISFKELKIELFVQEYHG